MSVRPTNTETGCLFVRPSHQPWAVCKRRHRVYHGYHDNAYDELFDAESAVYIRTRGQRRRRMASSSSSFHLPAAGGRRRSVWWLQTVLGSQRNRLMTSARGETNETMSEWQFARASNVAIELRCGNRNRSKFVRESCSCLCTVSVLHFSVIRRLANYDSQADCQNDQMANTSHSDSPHAQ